nr:anti-sigma factor domain-containing protein [Bacillus sp. FJAT-29790]
MEVNERFLTLLTPEGEFLRARKQNSQYQIGQEIDFFPVDQMETNKPSFLSILQTIKGKTAIAATLAFMLVILSFIPRSQSNEVYAYMSIDINPSIELGVNRKFQVLEMMPYNEDGERIVQQIHDWKKKDIQVVTKNILNEIKKQGYIKNKHEVVIATVYAQEEKKERDERWEQEMTEIKHVMENENLELKVVEGTKKDREQAKEKGLTTGLYKEKQMNTNISKPAKKNELVTTEQPKSEIMQEQSKIQTSPNKDTFIPPGQLKKEQNRGNKNNSEQGKTFEKWEDKQTLRDREKKEKEHIENNSDSSKKKLEEKSNHGDNRSEKAKSNSDNQRNEKAKSNSGNQQNEKAKSNSDNQRNEKAKSNSDNQRNEKAKSNSDNQQNEKEKWNSGNNNYKKENHDNEKRQND